MKKVSAVILGLLASAAFATAFPLFSGAADDSVDSRVITAVAENRCGWFHNPTPANAWLIDADGEWTISVQGGYQAEGNWPNFPDSRWVKTNINYGYGCACMRVTTNRSDMRIVRILSSTVKPISACRKDKALKGTEPN